MSAESADYTQKLASSLRTAASKAADMAGEGVALVFASTTGSALDMRLRAAAGFKRPDQAQHAAQQLLPSVRNAADSEKCQKLEPDAVLGDQGAGMLLVRSLRHEGVLYGALAIGAPVELDEDALDRAELLADHAALAFAYAQIEEECVALRELTSKETGEDEENSEEVLRLSEALFAQDIELLRSNEKLGKIERLKNDFIEKMSRELRTPLNSIIESVISVMTGENENLSEGAKEALRSSLDDGTAFLRTLQNILDLWKIKQGELPVEIQDINFREVVDEAIFNIQEAIGDKSVRAHAQIIEPLPRIRTDLTKMNQILFLLLDNAVKFTPNGEIEITVRAEENRLFCTIRDTGIGICPDDQQFIFDEFYQVDDPSSQKYQGAGLGLTLVRDLVTLLEGELTVSSDAGQGTTVGIEIPVQTV